MSALRLALFEWVKPEEVFGHSFGTFWHILYPIAETGLRVEHCVCGTAVLKWLEYIGQLSANTTIKLLAILFMLKYSNCSACKALVGVRTFHFVARSRRLRCCCCCCRRRCSCRCSWSSWWWSHLFWLCMTRAMRRWMSWSPRPRSWRRRRRWRGRPPHNRTGACRLWHWLAGRRCARWSRPPRHCGWRTWLPARFAACARGPHPRLGCRCRRCGHWRRMWLRWRGVGQRHNNRIAFKHFVDGSQKGVLFAAFASEVIGFHRPYHSTGQLHGFYILGFYWYAIDVIEANPLSVTECIRSQMVRVSDFCPLLLLLSHLANL